MALILGLPAEIIQYILHHVAPEDACAFGLASKRLFAVSNTAVLWAYYLESEYRYGDNVAPRQGAGTTDVEALREQFATRRRLDATVRREFTCIIESTRNRHRRVEEVASHGSNVKDVMLSFLRDETNLSYTFWANAILGRLHRSIAITAWIDSESTCDMPKLAEMLAAFDVFVLDGHTGPDFSLVGEELRRLGVLLKQTYPQLMNEQIHARAQLVAEFLRSQKFIGVHADDDYHNLRNNFIGLALVDKNHEALPLICTAIYCCLARDVGLEASPCSFPYHVYATITGGRRVVSGPADFASDTVQTIDEHLETALYIDAFRPGQEVPRSQLETLLREMSASQSTHAYFLSPASSADMVLRTGQNIVRSIQRIHQLQSQPPAKSPDLDMSFYATLFSSILLSSRALDRELAPIATRRRRYLPYIVEHFRTHCPWDVGLIEKHILPLFLDLPEGQDLRDIIRRTMIEDGNHPNVNRRGELERAKVQFSVGQIFRHKRYGYLAVIKGWNIDCQAGEAWIRQMNVDALSGGRHQSFYHVLVEDKSERYVAAENIEVTAEPPSAGLLRTAGRYFHRYDANSQRFISNIKEEYPHD